MLMHIRLEQEIQHSNQSHDRKHPNTFERLVFGIIAHVLIYHNILPFILEVHDSFDVCLISKSLNIMAGINGLSKKLILRIQIPTHHPLLPVSLFFMIFFMFSNVDKTKDKILQIFFLLKSPERKQK